LSVSRAYRRQTRAVRIASMPTSRAYGALPNVPRIFRTGTALCRAPRWRTAPARPAVIQTDAEQSRDATNTKFSTTRIARSTHRGEDALAEHSVLRDFIIRPLRQHVSHAFCGLELAARVPAYRHRSVQRSAPSSAPRTAACNQRGGGCNGLILLSDFQPSELKTLEL
jgi:hypothetical protein